MLGGRFEPRERPALRLPAAGAGPGLDGRRPVQRAIHDNYFHKNQHIGKLGYGVDVGATGHATIERNVFDLNRHAITAGGGPGIGYSATQNLVLRGGGYHGRFYEHYIQQFDVHGDDNCYTPSSSAWNCGNAGDSFLFAYNAFQYTAADAIHIRGRPGQSAYIHHNVFAHPDLGDAVELYTDENVTVGPNTTGFDSFGRYGVCDFDGDGLDDLFLPTGVTWWYSSAGRPDAARPQPLRPRVQQGDRPGRRPEPLRVLRMA